MGWMNASLLYVRIGAMCDMLGDDHFQADQPKTEMDEKPDPLIAISTTDESRR